MASFTSGAVRAKVQRLVVLAPQGHGPWGEAIVYWLKQKQWSQADLSAKSGIEAKTISTITRGFHTTTRMLEKIAHAFQVPFDAVLISPDRRLAHEERRRLAAQIAEDVMRSLDARQHPTLQERQDALVKDFNDAATELRGAPLNTPKTTKRIHRRTKSRR